MNLHTYLPQDRFLALTLGMSLPERTAGAALFADVSGFSLLTETLREHLGPRRGAEELSRYLDSVYNAIIAELERFGGSVIDFAGDSLLCWFDERQEQAAPRAVAAAFNLQAAMAQFSNLQIAGQATVSLTLKVAVASGPARRLVVGDPQIRYLDTLSGATIARTASAEHLAQKGEILLDETTVQQLGNALQITTWRASQESGEKFAVAGALLQLPAPTPLPAIQTPQTPSFLRDWLDQSVYQRKSPEFQTEFRPCVALFVRFQGIDYETDGAQAKLNDLVCLMQQISGRYQGNLLQLTIGDKGSYAYINFGALTTHENNSRRAAKTALELQEKSPLPLQIGITQGVMRVGAYGGATRQTFGALSDDVNLAARLMIAAAPGEILLNSRANALMKRHFLTETRPALQLKGRAEPISIYKLVGAQPGSAIQLAEPAYSLPMVGRRNELQIIEEKLSLALQKKSQIISIIAEAGLGKSRLVSEAIHIANQIGFFGYGSACQSDAINTPYLAWKGIWDAIFAIDPDMDAANQIRHIESKIEVLAPSRLDALPLLNNILGVNIPPNSFTEKLEPQQRQNILHALMEDCLKTLCENASLLIVLEDVHWMDELSHQLLEALAKTLANHPVCFLLAYRPPQLTRLQTPHIETLPQFTRIELQPLTHAETDQAVRAKLAQLYPQNAPPIPGVLMETLAGRTQGNPFYIEELLNYIHDQGLDFANIKQIDLPDSLHTLILSRIDQLTDIEKNTLRAASIIGRLFSAHWLAGYYPELGEFDKIKSALNELAELDLTPLNSPEPELAYIFKHIITHEVTYENLSFATRARLHEKLAGYIETSFPDAPPLATLAFHYSRSENLPKKIEYLRKAGSFAQENYANDAALEFYSDLLPLLTEPQEKFEILSRQVELFELLGRWDAAEKSNQSILEIAGADAAFQAEFQYIQGRLMRARSNYDSALQWLEQARATQSELGNAAKLAITISEIGIVFFRKGEYVQAQEALSEALQLAKTVGDYKTAILTLGNLAGIAWSKGDFTTAQSMLEEGLELRRSQGDKLNTASLLENLGLVTFSQNRYDEAQLFFEQGLAIRKKMGDKPGIAKVLGNMGLIAHAKHNYARAQELQRECLAMSHEVDDKWGMAVALGNLGTAASALGDHATAKKMHEESLAIKKKIGDKRGIAITLHNIGLADFMQKDYEAARPPLEECLPLARELKSKYITGCALILLGMMDLFEQKSSANAQLMESLRIRAEIGPELDQAASVTAVANLILKEGKPYLAVQLLSATKVIFLAINNKILADVHDVYQQTESEAKTALGDAAFKAAWEEGNQWDIKTAIRMAMGESTELP